MDIQTYLERIGVTAQHAPSLAYLTELQRQHLLHIPFENLSVIRGEPIVLDEGLLYAKVVERGRGGFCYELNGAFSWLLRELGFDVTRVAAGVYNAGPALFGPTFDHMTLLVQIDGVRYLVDVGFGDSARMPIPLPDGQVEDVSGRYRLLHVDDKIVDSTGKRVGTFILQKADNDGEWQPQYRFTDQPRALRDYVDRCTFLATSPASTFMQRTICTIATPDGRISLRADALTITRNGEKRKLPIDDQAAFAAMLNLHFGAPFVA